MHRTLALLAALSLAACDDEEFIPRAPNLGIDAGERPPDSDAEARRCSNPDDFDCDGYSLDAGDCDDNNPGLGPGAIDVPHNGIDEDCRDGDALGPPPVCDGDLESDDDRAESALRAFGLCADEVSLGSFRAGVIDVRWERLGGARELEDPRQVWLTERFGRIRPREGARMLVLSTGVARDVNAEDEYTEGCDVFSSTRQPTDGGFSGGAKPPRGFPRDSSRCGVRASEGAPAYNDVGLRVELRTPPNATGIAFDSLFLTYEYPDFVCKQFNDFFMVSLDTLGNDQDNIVLDANGDAIGVNTGLLSVCTEASPERVGRRVECASGPDLLLETGFAAGESTCAPLPAKERDIGGASTGWLHTEVAVKGGTRATLTFRLWDSADPLLDSTVLLDNFRFLTAPPRVGTVPVAVTTN